MRRVLVALALVLAACAPQASWSDSISACIFEVLEAKGYTSETVTRQAYADAQLSCRALAGTLIHLKCQVQAMAPMTAEMAADGSFILALDYVTSQGWCPRNESPDS